MNIVSSISADTADTAAANTYTRDDFERDITHAGKQYGQGANARPVMAAKAVQAANRMVGVTSQDAAHFYTLFQTAAHRAKGLEYSAIKESSFRQQVSKLTQFLKLGELVHVDGEDVFERAADRIRALGALNPTPLKGSAYDNLCNVARAQLKSPDVALTDEEIEGVLVTEKKPETAIEKLARHYAQLGKLQYEGDDNNAPLNLPALDETLANLKEAITEAGGDVPAITPEEKQRAKLLKLAEKAGLAISIA